MVFVARASVSVCHAHGCVVICRRRCCYSRPCGGPFEDVVGLIIVALSFVGRVEPGNGLSLMLLVCVLSAYLAHSASVFAVVFSHLHCYLLYIPVFSHFDFGSGHFGVFSRPEFGHGHFGAWVRIVALLAVVVFSHPDFGHGYFDVVRSHASSSRQPFSVVECLYIRLGVVRWYGRWWFFLRVFPRTLVCVS